MQCQADRARELISRRESRQPDRHADEATADATDTAVTGYLSAKVEGDRRSPCSGGRHSRQVCMSISWSQFSSRNRARDVGLTENCCAGASRKRALTCLVNIQPEMANISDLSDISDGELVSATIVLKWAMVYQRSGAGNRHFCNLLARIEDHINMILHFFHRKCNTELLWASQVYRW